MDAGGPARRSGDRCPRGQARRHHGQALNACASVQAPQAATEVPAHAAWPRHPRPSPQDHIARRPPGPATRSRVACAPSRAASARVEDLFVARSEVECIGRGKAGLVCLRRSPRQRERSSCCTARQILTTVIHSVSSSPISKSLQGLPSAASTATRGLSRSQLSRPVQGLYQRARSGMPPRLWAARCDAELPSNP
jgi:hypothetical protein